MTESSYLFTSESVSGGHPDKLADQISDGILDAVLSEDPNARVACETLITTGIVVVAGEISSQTTIDFQSVVRHVIQKNGYDHSSKGFDANACGIMIALDRQSPDIALGVDKDGAGDQGLMFGYACRETSSLMPAPIYYAHQLIKRQMELRQKLDWLWPDAKAQVSIQYEDGKPSAVSSIVLSSQHAPDIGQKDLKEAVMEEIIKPVIPKEWITSQTKYYINPTGRFVIGGPMGDCGLTGRKIIVDTYGGMARHGGGAFSGKDPSKVDRSAAYAARHVAKNIVAAGLADKVEIQLSYAIGVLEPVSIHIDHFGTSKYSANQLVDSVKECFDLTPKGIISSMRLKRPIYLQTATLGHFGRDDLTLPWEQIDEVKLLRQKLGAS